MLGHISLPTAVAAICVSLALAGCEPSGDSGLDSAKITVGSGAAPYKIVTTAGMVTDIVQIVAGERATVDGLMGEGVDPHLFKPTRGDVKRLLDADVIIYAGLNLEGRMSDTFIKVAQQGKPVYAVTRGVDESFLLAPPEFKGHWDPHLWMDVSAWSAATQSVAEALGEFDPANAAYYKQNADAYCEKLKRLDAYAKRVIASIPEQQRVLVTAHDAFGYFSCAYGISVEAVQGITTDSEAGLADINKLVQYVVDRKIPAIFIESSVSPKNIEAVIEAVRDKGHEVKVGGELFSDAMGKPRTYEGTYIGMIDHNVTTIARALGGQAPPRGLNGQLAPPKRLNGQLAPH